MKASPAPRTFDYAYLPPPWEEIDGGRAALRRSVRRPLIGGLLVVALLILGFGIWAATAPLAGGAVAPGVISPDGSRKTVQHLEGGIIDEILVRDGDFVSAGAPVLRLQDTQARATFDLLRGQHDGLSAIQARLVSEQLGHSAVAFPADLLEGSGDLEIEAILRTQAHLFETRRDAIITRKKVLEQRKGQIRQQIRGAEAQFTSSGRRLAIVLEELTAKETLFQKGLIPKPQLLALRREHEKIQGDRGEYDAAIARGFQQIGETELELASLDAQRADEVARELERVRAELAKVREQIRASEDTLRRTLITAPVSGLVVNLRFKTRGGVIQPGQPVLDIVPAEDDLLIDARLAPIDIDVVHPGLEAQVHLSAYAQRRMPQIKGVVRSVSADILRDEQSGAAYYLVRVEVDRADLAGLDVEVELVPGMPAEVLIVTSERTLLDYFLQPFRDVFRRGMREA